MVTGNGKNIQAKNMMWSQDVKMDHMTLTTPI